MATFRGAIESSASMFDGVLSWKGESAQGLEGLPSMHSCAAAAIGSSASRGESRMLSHAALLQEEQRLSCRSHSCPDRLPALKSWTALPTSPITTRSWRSKRLQG